MSKHIIDDLKRLSPLLPSDLLADAAAIAPLPHSFDLRRIPSLAAQVDKAKRRMVHIKFRVEVASMLCAKLDIQEYKKSGFNRLSDRLESTKSKAAYMDAYLNAQNIAITLPPGEHLGGMFDVMWHTIIEENAEHEAALADWTNKFCWHVTKGELERLGRNPAGYNGADNLLFGAPTSNQNLYDFLRDISTKPVPPPLSMEEIERRKQGEEKLYAEYCAKYGN